MKIMPYRAGEGLRPRQYRRYLPPATEQQKQVARAQSRKDLKHELIALGTLVALTPVTGGASAFPAIFTALHLAVAGIPDAICGPDMRE